MVTDYSYDDHIGIHKQPNPDKDKIATFNTIDSNLTPVVHLTKLLGNTTINPYVQIIKKMKIDSIEKIDEIGPEGSSSQVSKTSCLISDILKVFDKELHDVSLKHLIKSYNKKTEFEKKLTGTKGNIINII